MTINDAHLNACCLQARQLTDKLQILMRNGDVAELHKALDQAQFLLTLAGYRLNDLRYGSQQFAPYVEQMGG